MQTLRNASVPSALLGRPGSGLERVDIAIADGRIASIAPTQPGPGRDLDGGLVLPALVDIHTHLDKGHIWPRKENPDGSFMGALFAVKDDREARWTAADVRKRMEFSLRTAYAHGTKAIRTHLDSAGAQTRISWPVLGEARERWAGRIALQGSPLFGIELALD